MEVAPAVASTHRTAGKVPTDVTPPLPAPGDFVGTIDNRYFPLFPGSTYVYAGIQDGQTARNEVTVTNQSRVVDGVTTTVVDDKVFLKGQLFEQTQDWYAQDSAGNVWYFGEDSKEFMSDGSVSMEGSWEAGVGGATAGVVMEAAPKKGDAYRQEFSQGVAEDRASVASLTARGQSDFGTFGGCLKTNEFSRLDPGIVEQKYYAPGIGFIGSNIVKGGREAYRLTSYTPGPGAFVATIDNPYFPLAIGSTHVFEGTKDGSASRDEVVVTTDMKQVAGITVTVVQDDAFESGQLAEHTFDWYSQDKFGNVWYLGEDTQELQNGTVVNTTGSWEAGVNGATPGIVMEAHPRVGDTYRQEFAAGVAEDRSTILSVNRKATVKYGTFQNCVMTNDFSRLERGVLEHKLFAPGVGFISSSVVRGGRETTELAAVT